MRPLNEFWYLRCCALRLVPVVVGVGLLSSLSHASAVFVTWHFIFSGVARSTARFANGDVDRSKLRSWFLRLLPAHFLEESVG